MAYKWVDNEVFMRYKGITIYHVYKNNQQEAGPRCFHFGLSSYSSDESDIQGGVFDVRELYIRPKRKLLDWDAMREIIKENIDLKVIIREYASQKIDTKRLAQLRGN